MKDEELFLLWDFTMFVAQEIFEKDWETKNKETFTEIACRKLAKLGIVKAEKKDWILIEK